MIWLWIGVGLWSFLHFIPAAAQPLRASLIESLGNGKYRALFALGIFASIALMVLGWRSAAPIQVYDPPAWGRPLGSLLVLLGFLLFGLAHAKTNVKRYIRNPQLTGLVLWAAGHLLTNGDNRSFVLFGVLGVWALIEIVLLNRRDGVWVKPDPLPLTAEIKPLVIGTVMFTVFLFAHPYLFGVSPIPG